MEESIANSGGIDFAIENGVHFTTRFADNAVGTLPKNRIDDGNIDFWKD